MIGCEKSNSFRSLFSKTVIVSFDLPFLASNFSLFSVCIQKSGEYTLIGHLRASCYIREGYFRDISHRFHLLHYRLDILVKDYIITEYALLAQ